MSDEPDVLRYILWRYGQDHQGEDHQARVAEVQAWLDALEQAAPVSAMEPVSDDVIGAIKSLIVHAEATDMLPYSRNVVIAWLMLQRPATAAGEEG